MINKKNWKYIIVFITILILFGLGVVINGFLTNNSIMKILGSVLIFFFVIIGKGVNDYFFYKLKQ